MNQLHKTLLWGALSGALVGFASCSSGDSKPPTQSFGVDTGGAAGAPSASRGSRGSDSGGTGGSTSDGGFDQPGAPIVTMLAPKDEDEPNDVYHESMTPRCRVEQSDVDEAKEPDPSSIVFELVDEDDMVLDAVDGSASDEDGVYEATFATQNLPPGPVTVRCTAGDTSDDPLLGRDSANTFIDHGPTITIVSPEEGAAESASSAVAFEYEILPNELVDQDDGAEVDEVSLSVRGEDFDLVELEDSPGVYRTTIDFTDPNVFAEVPSGSLQVSVTASNSRDEPVTAAERYEFLLDGTGPKITIDSPGDGAIVGGTVNMRMTVTDSVSAVDWDTLVVTLNDEGFPYDADGPWTRVDDEMTFQFESAQVEGSVVQININVAAKDVAGNESAGESALYYRDEQPPLITMDAPFYRAVRDASGGGFECSHAFDPLGDAADDGARVLDVAVYRALVYDETNTAPGVTVLHMAGTNTGSVQLFVRRPDDDPLVIDTTDDGNCDDIDEQDTRFQDLTQLAVQGAPFFGGADDGVDEGLLPDPSGYCDVLTGRTEPNHLCPGEASDLYVVLSHDLNKNESVVYAINPDTNGLECTGRGWELRSAALEDYQGWVCMAVRAFDRVGNRGISRPIAVCLENDMVDGEPSCWTDLGEAPPDCTDGCTPPPEFYPDGVFYEN